jgi:hypothetical protein
LGGIIIYKDPNFPNAGAVDAGAPSDAGVAPARDAGANASLAGGDAGVRVPWPEPR